jgi:hypothetical protein
MTSSTQPPERIRRRRRDIVLVSMAYMAGHCGRGGGRYRDGITFVDGHACDTWRGLRGRRRRTRRP